MKRNHVMRLFLAVALVGGITSGCSFVSSAQGGDESVTGEAWYVRTSIFGGGKVFYCPAGENVCIRATMVKN